MWPEAVDQFQRAVAVSPDDPSLLLDLGVVLREAGRLSEAAETLQRAMDANPRDSRVPYHLAITLEAEHRPTEARAALNHFLALAPTRYGRQIADAQQRLAALPN
jgi:Flp pilus assembly protein TadD